MPKEIIDITKIIADHIDIEDACDTYHELGDYEYEIKENGMYILYSIDRIYGGENINNPVRSEYAGNSNGCGVMDDYTRQDIDDIDITVLWCRYELTHKDVPFIFDIEKLKKQII